MILIDSDVLIWLTRGHEQARERLARVDPWRISVVTYLELAQGCRNKAELDRLKRGLAIRETMILPLTPAISDRCVGVIEEFALSHGIQMADALIAATALEHGLTVLTANAKHFTPITGLDVETFEPR
jgi:hypothetical protein